MIISPFLLTAAASCCTSAVLKSHRAAAPLRETIAAAVLKIAGFTENEPLIDPMCGSGTFSLEAAMLVKHIPAGWFREFCLYGMAKLFT